MKSIVLKEWMRIALCICLLGLPVILGYFTIQIVEARNTEIAKNSLASDLNGEFDFSRSVAMERNKTPNSQALPLGRLEKEAPRSARVFPGANSESKLSGKGTLRHPHTGTRTEAPASLVFLNYGDMLTTAQLLPAAAATYLSRLFPGFTPHKNGRLIDTASYVRSTIR